LAEWLAERLPGSPPLRLHGLDLSAGMLGLARARSVVAVQADLDRLPYPDGAFGAVLAFTTLAIAPGPVARALAEIARVLAPGGLLAVSVLARSAPPDFDRDLGAAGLLAGPRIPCGQDAGWVAVRAR
jgi:SAM-dependent methyltransferase